MIEALAAFVAGPGVLYLILAVLGAETLLFVALGRARLVPNLAAGACLVLAMLVIVLGGGWGWIGLLLSAAFAAHLVDLFTHWKR